MQAVQSPAVELRQLVQRGSTSAVTALQHPPPTQSPKPHVSLVSQAPPLGVTSSGMQSSVTGWTKYPARQKKHAPSIRVHRLQKLSRYWQHTDVPRPLKASRHDPLWQSTSPSQGSPDRVRSTHNPDPSGAHLCSTSHSLQLP